MIAGSGFGSDAAPERRVVASPASGRSFPLRPAHRVAERVHLGRHLARNQSFPIIVAYCYLLLLLFNTYYRYQHQPSLVVSVTVSHQSGPGSNPTVISFIFYLKNNLLLPNTT